MKTFIVALDHENAGMQDLLLKTASDSTELVKNLLSESSEDKTPTFRFKEVSRNELLEIVFDSETEDRLSEMASKEYVIKIGELESFREG